MASPADDALRACIREQVHASANLTQISARHLRQVAEHRFGVALKDRSAQISAWAVEAAEELGGDEVDDGHAARGHRTTGHDAYAVPAEAVAVAYEAIQQMLVALSAVVRGLVGSPSADRSAVREAVTACARASEVLSASSVADVFAQLEREARAVEAVALGAGRKAIVAPPLRRLKARATEGHRLQRFAKRKVVEGRHAFHVLSCHYATEAGRGATPTVVDTILREFPNLVEFFYPDADDRRECLRAVVEKEP